MRYSIIPASINSANYSDSTGALFNITTISEASQVIGSKAIITTSIDGYTPLPAYVASQAAVLQSAKTKAIQKLQKGLSQQLLGGIVVSVGENSFIIPADPVSLAAFSQGAVVIQTAESLVTDISTIQSTMVSVYFGRGIADVGGVLHDMTVSQYKQMVMYVAQTVGGLQGTLQTKVNIINAATTVAAVNAVS